MRLLLRKLFCKFVAMGFAYVSADLMSYDGDDECERVNMCL